jgi:hypothetical protein
MVFPLLRKIPQAADTAALAKLHQPHRAIGADADAVHGADSGISRHHVPRADPRLRKRGALGAAFGGAKRHQISDIEKFAKVGASKGKGEGHLDFSGGVSMVPSMGTIEAKRIDLCQESEKFIRTVREPA